MRPDLLDDRGKLTEQRLADAAANLLGLGLTFSLVAMLLGQSVFGSALSSLLPLTLLMTVVGALLLRLTRARDGAVDEVGEANLAASSGVTGDLDQRSRPQ